MKILLLGSLIGVLWLFVDYRIDKAHAEGFRVGMNYALKSDPPSEELEMRCAGLWVGKQNRKEWDKHNAR
jgi:hypothetical protein